MDSQLGVSLPSETVPPADTRVEPWSRRKKLTVCSGVVMLCMLSNLSTGYMTYTMMRSLSDSAPIPPPVAPVCGSCSASHLVGPYKGFKDVVKHVLGMTFEFSYTVSHDFQPGSTVDVTFTPVKNPSMVGLVPFHCPGVPYTLDEKTCQLSGIPEDSCMKSGMQSNKVTSMTFQWDGKQNLTIYQSVNTPAGSETQFWSELLQNGSAPTRNCSGKPAGPFQADVTLSKSAGIFQETVKFHVSHDFRDSVVDVTFVPTESPMGAVKAFHCEGVPFTVDAATCAVSFMDDCLSQAYAMNHVQLLEFTWDGGTSLSAHEVVKAAGLVKEPFDYTETKQAAILA